MNDDEAQSYAHFVLGLEYSRTNNSPDSLWMSISNWLERNRRINPNYGGSLSASDLRRMSQISMSKYEGDESMVQWGNNNIPLLLKALASKGFFFTIQVIQPDKNFQPFSNPLSV